MSIPPGEITLLLSAMREGQPDAPAELARLLYPELHRMARREMGRERPDHTLQPTALVNEAYLKLTATGKDWKNRAHFLSVAAHVMRQILVDYARHRHAVKRGGIRKKVADETPPVELPTTDVDRMLALDAALCRLSQWDEKQSRIVEMRFFGGLQDSEIAEVLGISVRTVQREWSLARAWLHSQIG